MSAEPAKSRANEKKQYVVKRDQLPLSCPSDEMRVWDSHPKVYLPLEETGKAKCPYCDAQYVLEGHEDAPESKLLA
jgi:uncharacterized Zn-finger protein